MAANDDRSTRSSSSRDEVELRSRGNIQVSDIERGRSRIYAVKEEAAMDDSTSMARIPSKSSTHSPKKTSRSPENSDTSKSEEIVRGEVIFKMEPGQPPKLARSSSQKIPSRPVELFTDYASKTEEAKGVFEIIPTCTYSSKSMGATEHGMDCDCSEEWDSYTKTNAACGEDSDCINRATKIECVGDCGCGPECQNQRFQKRAYANVTVIQTEKKGYGLRADTDVNPHDFIYEYIGEVVNEVQFRRRTVQYNDEGIKHFYFMSLTKNEFVDATKKGNLGRFCNHSCNPNCYVDKWVVGEKLRMGIFAERKIKAGEELVFNYNVDRYGADPQPCYCGEPNCTGYIGGKTQTERATQLSTITIEALGIDDGDGWDTAVAKRPRKKKAGEDDEEYVNNVQPKALDEDGVTKVMATLMQCKDKWIAVKVLSRIQRCEDEKVRNRVVKMHGYQILNSTLTLWKDDFNVVLQILDILEQFPRLTRNKISDSKIESSVENLRNCGDGRVETRAAALLQEWSTLEVAYRIPRKKREINDTATPEKPDRYSRRESGPNERRGRSRSRSKSRTRSRSRSMDAPRGPAAPSGPRGTFPQRNPAFYGGPRPSPIRRVFPPPLPSGWHSALQFGTHGTPYYYTATGETTWERPTKPALPPPPPPKPTSANPALDAIIKEIEESKANERKGKASASTTPRPLATDIAKDKKVGNEKWRSYSEEKQKKLYENTLYPPIKYVVDKFKHKLPKEELKKFAKQVAKKLVESDFKHQRVDDPTKISSRQEHHVKKYVKDYFEKVVAQRKAHEKRKAERRALRESQEGVSVNSPAVPPAAEEQSDEELGVPMSDDEVDDIKPDSNTPITPAVQLANGDALKRKRDHGDDMEGMQVGEQATPTKRQKSGTPPPPPPPPPPASSRESLVKEEGVESDLLASLRFHDNEAVTSLDTTTNTNGSALSQPTPIDASPLARNGGLSPPRLRSKAYVSTGDDLGGIGQSAIASPFSPHSGFVDGPDQEQGPVFDVGNLHSAPKLQVGNGV